MYEAQAAYEQEVENIQAQMRQLPLMQFGSAKDFKKQQDELERQLARAEAQFYGPVGRA